MLPRLAPGGDAPLEGSTAAQPGPQDGAAAPSAGVAGAGDEGQAAVRDAQQPPARPAEAAAVTQRVAAPAPAPPWTVADLLARQNAVLATIPAGRVLEAVRDTGAIAWARAATRRDSADAAGVLARAALLAGDLPACRRWALRGLDLSGADFFRTLLEACP
jgi:hypothetical protein